MDTGPGLNKFRFLRRSTEKFKMTRARRDGLYLLILGSLAFILLGAALEYAARAPFVDFRGLYYPAQCLLRHHDPYVQSEVLSIYRTGGIDRPTDLANERQTATRYVYPPTSFIITVPFAVLPWGPAHILWMVFTIGSFILASALIWDIGANDAPLVSGILIGFFLANSVLLVISGNAAGIAISLCLVAVWCFLRERYVPAGILCLALSLAIKPHDTVLVWLYFLLAGGILRKRAWQTLLATTALSLPVVLWVWQVSPHWVQEMNSNILANAAHGAINDPGIASSGGHGVDMLISLQSVISFFRDDPHIYNPVSYLICAPLLVVWVFVTLRSRLSPKLVWLALASISALTMLPFYHRMCDAKLLLLTVPACAMLLAEGGLIGRLALVLNSAAFVLTGDLSWGIIIGVIRHLHVPATRLSEQLVDAAQAFPVPLILLVLGVFYLWIYVQHCSIHDTAQPV